MRFFRNEALNSGECPSLRLLKRYLFHVNNLIATKFYTNTAWNGTKFYNNERPHQSLGYKTPHEVYYGL